MAEFEMTKPQAEKALLENGGDLIRALEALVTPPNFTQDNTDAVN